MIRFLVLSTVMLLAFNAKAQPSTGNPSNAAPRVIPASPEASSLGKFADVPVSLYTGIPEVSIPLYDLSRGSLKLGIGLSYHASGIKVEEMASWVGIGWALNAGGVVTRTVKGKPDDCDHGQGFLEYAPGKSPAWIASQTQVQQTALFQEIAEGTADAEPDMYFVNVNGITAQFTFDWNGNIVQSEDKRLKIVKIQDVGSANPYKILGWDVTDDQGTVFKFRTIETTNADPVGVTGDARNGTFASSWYLSEIVDVNNENAILLTYDSYVLDYKFQASVNITHLIESYYDFNCGGGYPGVLSQTNTRTSVSGKRISQIKTDDNTLVIDFIPGLARTDTEQLWPSGNSTNFKMLDKVIIKDVNSSEIKSFDLEQDYSNGRLTLKSVVPQVSGQNASPPFNFTYNSLDLPSAVSKAQDHWGYFNGEITNTHLVPAQNVATYDNGTIFAGGANRNASPMHTRAGALEKITYPTGGYTEFDFEPHEYGYIQSTPIAYYSKLGKVTQGVSMTEQEVQGTNTTKSLNVVINENPERPGQNVPVRIDWTAFTDAVTGAKKPWVKIYNINTPATPRIYFVFGMQDPNVGQFGTSNIDLEPGTYVIQASCQLFDEVNDYASISVQYEQFSTTPSFKKMAGGLRIKEIRQYAFAGDPYYTTKQFSYTLQQGSLGSSPDNVSSGVIYQEPIYGYEIKRYCLGVQGELDTRYYVRLANNVTVLGLTQNSYIGYREVVTTYGKGNEINGKTISEFTSPHAYNDVIYTALPFRPAGSRAYKTGLLRKQTDYKYVNGNYNVVKEKSNEFIFAETNSTGLAVLFLGGNQLYKNYKSGFYDVIIGKSAVVNSIDRIYASDASNNNGTTEINYSYTPSLSHLREETKLLESGQTESTVFSYPFDYTSPSQIISSMVALNIVATPIEVIMKRNGLIVGGEYNEFHVVSGKIRPKQKLGLSTASPISVFNYSKDAVSGVPDSRYEQKVNFDLFDNRGNILQFTTADGITSSYLWGYYSTYPVAEIKNATYQQAKSALGIATPTIDLGAGALSAGQMASLKSSLPDALITTYTYLPYIGLYSSTDPNGITSTYDYDDLRRLKWIKDNNGNVVKQFTYKYKTQ